MGGVANWCILDLEWNSLCICWLRLGVVKLVGCCEREGNDMCMVGLCG